MRKILISGGRLIDPAGGTDERLDVLVADGVIAALAPSVEAGDALVVDATGRIVAPGLVDMHVHFREPGREDEETILSGSLAAAHGGVTSVATMPNTEPAIDTASWVAFVRNHESPISVYPIAAITVGREGKALTEMAELAAAGAVAFSDDGSPVASGTVMRRALEYASMVGRPIIAHCEDLDLAGHGVANEGQASTIAGLPGIPAAAEEAAVARDIILARTAGARLHIAHVSTRGSVELVRRAKADGTAVTCETCPHYFALTDDEVRDYNTNMRVNPPLRSADDVAAVRRGIADGTIDVIASDHAPHSLEEKQVEFDAAPPGVIGVETLLSVTLTALVETGVLALARAIELMTSAPARILEIPAGSLDVGAPADVCVFDPAATWEVGPDDFLSKSRNSPWIGRRVTGRVMATIAKGEPAFGNVGGTSEEHRGDARSTGEREPQELPLHA
jgi:dihydroorotase